MLHVCASLVWLFRSVTRARWFFFCHERMFWIVLEEVGDLDFGGWTFWIFLGGGDSRFRFVGSLRDVALRGFGLWWRGQISWRSLFLPPRLVTLPFSEKFCLIFFFSLHLFLCLQGLLWHILHSSSYASTLPPPRDLILPVSFSNPPSTASSSPFPSLLPCPTS